MKTILALCLLLAVAGCASLRGARPGAGAIDCLGRRARHGWPGRDPQNAQRRDLVLLLAPAFRPAGVRCPPRLTEENVKRIVPNQTRAEEVRELFGPPYEVMRVPRMEREMWTWYMRRFGDPGIPAQLVIQLSPDGVVREVYLLDDSDRERNIVPGLR